MEKSFVTDFYTVSMPENETRSFADLLAELRDIPDDETRNYVVENNPVRFTSLTRARSGVWEGDFVKIRMDVLPPVAKTGGGVAPLRLEDDEGIGEEAAFMYDPRYNVLAKQRNRYAVSPTMLCEYINYKCQTRGPITLNTVLRQDAWDRLGNLHEVRKVKFKIAPHTNVAGSLPRDVSTKEFFQAADHFSARHLVVEMSVGRSKNTLATRAVKQLAKALAIQFRDHEDSVDRVELWGNTEDGDRDHFDMVNFRLKDEQQITIERDRAFTYDEVRRPALYRAWSRQQEELKQILETVDET